MCGNSNCNFYFNGLCKWENKCMPDDCPFKNQICGISAKSMIEKMEKMVLHIEIDDCDDFHLLMMMYNKGVKDAINLIKEEFEISDGKDGLHDTK